MIMLWKLLRAPGTRQRALLWALIFLCPLTGATDGNADRNRNPAQQRSGEGEVTESPRERGRLLLKRNPLASEFQAGGALGRSSGAVTDGEGSDFRTRHPRTGQLHEKENLMEVEVFATIFEGPRKAEPGFEALVRHLPEGDWGNWAVEVRANETAGTRLTEYNSAIWEPLTGTEPDYILQRMRVHQDAIYTRTRSALIHAEYQAGPGSTLFAQLSWANYFDESTINQLEFNLGPGRQRPGTGALPELENTITEAHYEDVQSRRYFRYGETRRSIGRLQVGGQHDLDSLTLDYAVYYSDWDNRLIAEGWNFYEGGLDVGYRVPEDRPYFLEFDLPPGYDLSGETASFGDYRDVIVTTRDKDLAGRIDLSRRFGFSASTLWLSGGLHYRSKERTRGWWNEIYFNDPQQPVLLSAVSTSTYPGPIVRGRYDLLPPELDRSRVEREATGSSTALRFDSARSVIEEAQELYVTREAVTGYYGQAIWRRGQWTLVGGLRGEQTRTETLGTVLVPEQSDSGDGRLLGEVEEGGTRYIIREVPGENRYTSWLPSVDLEWRIHPEWTLRATSHRRLMRPQYFDIVNYRRVSSTIFTISEGNPDLQAVSIDTRAVAVEYRAPWMGEFSMELFSITGDGFFYKAQLFEVLSNELHAVSRVENGGRGELRGVEAHWKRTFESERGKVTPSLAYTFSDSEALFPTRPDERLPLPERSRHHWKAGLDGSVGRVGGNATFSYQSASLDQVGPAADRDIYRDKVVTLDASLWWQFREHWRAKVSVLNLSDAPERSYEGNRLRILRNQYAFTTWRVGVVAQF